MQTFYVAPGIGTGNGSGPGAADAAPDLSSINWEADTTVLFRRGTSLYLPPRFGRAGIFIPAYNGIRFSHYGQAEAPPILHGAAEYASGWTNTGNGVYSIVGPDQSGVVLYQGQPLPFFDHAISQPLDQLAASSVGGYMIGSGGPAPTVYVRLPNGANPNNGGVAISGTMIGIECTHDSAVSGVDIDGLELMGFSRQGINLRNVHNSTVRNNVVHATGGDRAPTWYVGGCIQCTEGCDDIVFSDNHVYDCFDSPFSPQIPAGRDNALIQNIVYRDNLVDGGWALAGVEIANWANNGTIRNVRIESNRIVNGGSGFSGMGDGPRGPLGVIVNSNRGPSTGNTFENIEILNNHIEGCPSGGVFFEHADTPGSTVARNTIRNCGHAGPRGRAGNGNVQQRGGVEIATDQPLDQVIHIIANEIADCGVRGVTFNSRNATSAGSIVNNTLIRNGDDNVFLNGNSSLPTVRNNICYGAGIRKQGSAALQENYNNVHPAATPFAGFTPGANSTQVAPLLVDPVNGDFQLRTDSPLVGAGNQVAAQDRLGRSYQTQDLGCYANRPSSDCVDLIDVTSG